MNAEKTTRTVVRALLPWNDVKQERWLMEQARSGWHLKAVHTWGYTFERGAPADVAYRVDVTPRCRADRAEYLTLFRDAGWEHVGVRGLWHIFRKPVVGGEVPEIHTDPASRIAMYQRVAGFLAIMSGVLVTQVIPQLSRIAAQPEPSGLKAVLVIQLVAMGWFVYGIARVARVIGRLRRQQKLAG